VRGELVGELEEQLHLPIARELFVVQLLDEVLDLCVLLGQKL